MLTICQTTKKRRRGIDLLQPYALPYQGWIELEKSLTKITNLRTLWQTTLSGVSCLSRLKPPLSLWDASLTQRKRENSLI